MTNALYVAWRAGDADRGRWGPVGRLEHGAAGYRFLYTRGARMLPGFTPFPEMPDLDAVYESKELFPLFANRILARSRREYDAYLRWGDFDPDNPPDPIAVLGVTEGRRATDALELFPCPVGDMEGTYVNKFFLHGVRWMSPQAVARIDALVRDEPLGIMLDIQNPDDADAVAVRTCDVRDRFMIGYVPRYLARDVKRLCFECDPEVIELSVQRVNPDAPLQQRVLCRMEACWPEGFRPCSDEEYQPLVELEELSAGERPGAASEA